MTKDELIERLKALKDAEVRDYDPDRDHAAADEDLLEFINDPDIAAAYRKLTRWFA